MVEDLASEGTLGESPARYKAEVRNLSFYYDSFAALKNINMMLHEKKSDRADRTIRMR